MKKIYDFGIAVSNSEGKLIHYTSTFDGNPLSGPMSDHVADPDALLLAWAKAVTTGEPVRILAIARRNGRPFHCHLFRLPPGAFMLSFSIWGMLAETRLTDRETSVCRMLVDGVTTGEIAARLDVSLQSVNLHRRSAMEKLGAKTSEQLGVLFRDYVFAE